MTEPHRNLRTMGKNECGTAIVSQFDCGYDALARRSSVVNSGQTFTADAFNLYGYNDRNELGQSSRYLGNNIAVTATPVPSEHRAYGYDPIGNRTQSTVGSLGWSYASNELNQYTLESVSGDGTDTFSYDEDGNLTAIDFVSAPDVAYTYDAENRLIAVAPPTPAAGDKKTEFLYDYMGRRVRKQVSTYTDGAWTPETQKLYVYDGWNLIAEIDGSGTRYHVWGLDLSGTLQGAGGIGGLLGTFKGTDGYFALYDTNGNVTDYVDSQGAVVAHYEYDPYGAILTASGTKQSDFALRFSTKYLDDTGLYYYGYRYYSPGMGRWLTRDPIGSQGGINIYCMGMNDPINQYDQFGLLGNRIGSPINPEYYSCNCGWIDMGHFRDSARLHKDIMDGINAYERDKTRATFSLGAPVENNAWMSQKVTYTLNYVKAVGQSLAEDSKRKLALDIFFDFQIGWEKFQGSSWLDIIPQSSFSVEDLPSDFLGFMHAAGEINFYELCNKITTDDSYKMFQWGTCDAPDQHHNLTHNPKLWKMPKSILAGGYTITLCDPCADKSTDVPSIFGQYKLNSNFGPSRGFMRGNAKEQTYLGL